MPNQPPVISKRIGADRKNAKPSPVRNRHETHQGSDNDSGVYHVRSQTVLRKRPPIPRYTRSARDNYFDKVLNNSDASSEECNDHDCLYVCEDCRMESANKSKTTRRPKPKPNDEESYSEEDSSPPPRRQTTRSPEKPKRQVDNRKHRAPKPPSPDRSDYSNDSEAIKSAPARGKSYPSNRRSTGRKYVEAEYSDFDSNEDECSNGYADQASPRQRYGSRNKSQDRKPPQSASPSSRNKPSHREVYERKVSAPSSKPNKEYENRMRRRQIQQDDSSESWSESSDQSDASQDKYQNMERTRQPSRQTNRKKHMQNENNEPLRQQNRPNRHHQGKPAPGPSGRRRAAGNNYYNERG